MKAEAPGSGEPSTSLDSLGLLLRDLRCPRNAVKTFREIEKKFPQLHVSLAEPGLSGSGLLILNGDGTRLSLTTSGELKPTSDGHGWFDLRLKAVDGTMIYLHNALVQYQQLPRRSDTPHHYDIFPNFVVFGADALTENGGVESVSFSTDRLREFFRYEVVEWQLLSSAPAETLEALRSLRNIGRAAPREYAFFQPHDVLIIHRLPQALAFRVGERSYKVETAAGFSFGLDRADVKAAPRATIAFDEAVSISAAFNRVLEWRRFFAQAAIEPLPFAGITINRGPTHQLREALVYVPGLTEKEATRRTAFHFGPEVMPFHSWAEREQLGALMKGWLEKQPDRIIFRGKVDRVIARMHERIDASDIMDLASGLESLVELDRTSPYTSDQIEILVSGACEAAKDAGIDIDAQRLRGLLGLLRKENLGRRLASVLDATRSWLPPHDDRAFAKAIQEARNRGAHGTSAVIPPLRQMSQMINALTGLCVLWDLTSSGLDINAAQRHLNALSLAEHMLSEAFPRS